MSRENASGARGGTAPGRVSIRSRLDEPGEPGHAARLLRLDEVSIRSRLDEPGERAPERLKRSVRPVSIRSRLDEPGERAICCCPTPYFEFQSAPGSMSRENLAKTNVGANGTVFQSAPGSMSRENRAWVVGGVLFFCFNPLPAR